MTGSGIGKHLRVAEIGGLGNLYPLIEKNKYFDLKVIFRKIQFKKYHFLGS
jgi:hypothetical protein